MISEAVGLPFRKSKFVKGATEPALIYCSLVELDVFFFLFMSQSQLAVDPGAVCNLLIILHLLPPSTPSEYKGGSIS